MLRRIGLIFAGTLFIQCFISTIFVFPVERLSDTFSYEIGSLFSNPAGITRVHSTQFGMTYGTYFENQYALQSVSLILPLTPQLTLGLGVPIRKIDDIPITISDKGVGVQIGSFTDIEVEGLCSLGYRLSDRFAIGINISPLYHKLYQDSGSALTLDFGICYSDPVTRTFIDFSGKNIISTAKKWSNGTSESFCQLYQAGLSTALTSEIDIFARTSFETISYRHDTIGATLVFDHLNCSLALSDMGKTNQIISGVTLKTEDLTIQYQMISQANLGVSQTFGVTFQL